MNYYVLGDGDSIKSGTELHRLAKKYLDEKDYKFINAVLDKMIKE